MIRPRLLLLIFLCFTWLTYAPSDAKAQDSPPSPIFPLPALEPITAENAARLQELAVIGRGTLASADLSPDGNLLAVGTTAGVWFYDFNDLSAEPVYLYTGVGFNSDVQFDVTGQYLQVVTYLPDVGNGSSMLWQLSEDLSQSKSLGEGRIIADKKYLSKPDGSLINTITGEQLHFKIPQSNDANAPISFVVHIAINPQADLIAMVKLNSLTGYGKELELFDLDSGQLLSTLALTEESSLAQLGRLAFTPDGHFLFGHVFDSIGKSALNTIYMWSISDLLNNKLYLLQDSKIIWQEKDRSIVRMQSFTDMLLIETSTRERLRSTEIVSIPDGVVQKRIDNSIVLVHPRSHDLISFDSPFIDQWRIRNETTDEILGNLTNFGAEITDFRLNMPETQALVITQWSDTERTYTSSNLFDTRTWGALSPAQDLLPFYAMARFQPNGRGIEVVFDGEQTGDKRLEIRDVNTRQSLYTFPDPFAQFPKISVSEDGALLFVSTEYQYWLYDISQPEAPQLLALPYQTLGEATFHLSPDGNYLAKIERNGKSRFLRVWDTTTSQEVAQLNNRRFQTGAGGSGVDWVSNGEILVLCEKLADDNDRMLSFWQFDQLLVDPYITPIMSVAPNLCLFDMGSTDQIAIPTYGDGLSIWDIKQQRHIITVGDTENQWWRMAKFSPDGSIVFGIEYFGKMTAWSLDGAAIATFNFVPWPVIDLLFMDEGRLLVMPGSDGTIRLWGVPVEDER